MLGIPNLIFQVQWDQVEHKVTTDMTKGFFIIKGNEFIRKSVLQFIDLSEEIITHKCLNTGGRTVAVIRANPLLPVPH